MVPVTLSTFFTSAWIPNPEPTCMAPRKGGDIAAVGDGGVERAHRALSAPVPGVSPPAG